MSSSVDEKNDDLLLQNLKEKLSFESFLPMQTQILPILFDTIDAARRRGFHRDCLIASPTGSGKTLCYLLPIVNYLQKHSVNPSFKCLVIAPSKDLCLQIDQVLSKLTSGTRIRHTSIYGSNKHGFKQEHEQLCANAFDIVISTPIRLIDHVSLARRTTSSTQQRLFSNLCFLVVDEADKVVGDEKFKLLIQNIIADKETKSPSINNDDYYKARENDFLMKLLFSATLTNDPNLLSFFNLKYPYYYNITELTHSNDDKNADNNNKRKTITSETKQSTNDDDNDDSDDSDREDDRKSKKSKQNNDDDDNDDKKVLSKSSIASSLPSTLKISFFVIEEDEKLAQIFTILKSMSNSTKRVLCFANSVDVVSQLTNQLQQLEEKYQRLHSDSMKLKIFEYSSALSIVERTNALKKFSKSNDDCRYVLVCSDSFARGFDVDNVGVVLHCDVVQSPVTFAHRAGRSARAGAEGCSISLLSRRHVYHFKQMLEGVDITQMQLEPSQYVVLSHVKDAMAESE